MKQRATVFLALIVLIFHASCASAWEVRIHNRCSNADVKVEVEGEHLFWKSKDCSTTVAPKKNGNCVLPWGICIHKIKVIVAPRDKQWTSDSTVTPGWVYDNSGSAFPACWDVDFYCSDSLWFGCDCTRDK